uniref:Uncharacterized protein n=1 Tax=Arundo donax TaxID=35708 RepID=A0A0A9F787_ARUDO
MTFLSTFLLNPLLMPIIVNVHHVHEISRIKLPFAMNYQPTKSLRPLRW